VEKSKWESFIPWFLTVASAATISLLVYFLVDNILWFRESLFSQGPKGDPAYITTALALYVSTLKRSVGFFSAFCLIFIGTGISLYVAKKSTKLDMSAHDVKVSIITASPGILAMILGVLLMIVDISSKDTVNGSSSQSAMGTERTAQIQ
jgi:hypothetical protein